MIEHEVINWLLEGDVSIQFQTHRDLMNSKQNVISRLQNRISLEGWGKMFLDLQKVNYDWGNKFYHPKWTCTHYTLLDLKSIGIIVNDNIERSILKSINYLLQITGVLSRELCVFGMLVNYASYFNINQELLEWFLDFILKNKMSDNAWNCEFNRKGARHSSVHTSINVLEGLFEFIQSGNDYRKQEIENAIDQGVEFLMRHHLYKSCTTGKIITPKLLKLYYPTRWYYTFLRALDFFQYAKIKRDDRMEDALNLLKSKEKSGKWHANSLSSGQIHFKMDQPRQPSRWVTLQAKRVLNQYPVD